MSITKHGAAGHPEGAGPAVEVEGGVRLPRTAAAGSPAPWSAQDEQDLTDENAAADEG